MSAARERLARLLDGKDSAGSFSAQFLTPADSLRVEIEGVGQLKLPVTPAQARKLIQRAKPASFGRGEETLTDDTWEITLDQVTITTTGWPALLDNIRDDLGLPPHTRLSAELHSMLVYGKGQFFLPHQDSEKDDDMVATLVLTLPSKHTAANSSFTITARASSTEHTRQTYRSPRSMRTAAMRSRRLSRVTASRSRSTCSLSRSPRRVARTSKSQT